MTTGHARPFVPFADDAASSAIGTLTIENGRDHVTLYGSLDLSRDKEGLRQALALKQLLDAVVSTLQAEPALPDRVPADRAPNTVSNPFA